MGGRHGGARCLSEASSRRTSGGSASPGTRQWIYASWVSSLPDLPHEFVVDAPLADELERRGVHVHAGDRVRLELVSADQRDDDPSEAWAAFVGSFSSGDPDFAERSEDILQAEFGR